ncbi:unnamed protein product [marine sediment metagenome]|uniref:Uncharacterized protein n=1 Tax=marine sediment metagenome TaxID=412755 RepID=X1B3J5_9ZZZZ
MKLLGKEIKINSDVEFGLLEDLQTKGDKEPAVMKRFISAVTGLTQKEVRKLKQSELFEVMQAYQKEAKRVQTEYKKKLILL